MNTRMLLTAVLRNRRSQWTLLPKGDAARTADGDEGGTPPPPPATSADAQRGSDRDPRFKIMRSA